MNSVKLKMFSNTVSFETCRVLQQEDRGVYCTMPSSHLCYGLHNLNVVGGMMLQIGQHLTLELAV